MIKIGVFLLLVLVLLSSNIVFGNEIIEGNKVFINDSKIFLSVDPHTLKQGDSIINLELLSKVYTGDVNLIFGFDKSMEIEKAELYKPYNVIKRNYFTCDADADYSLNPNWVTCSYEDTVNNTQVILYNDYFDGYDLPSKTVYQNQEVLRNWKTLNFDNDVFNYEYGGVNKWVFVNDLPIVQDVNYKAKVYFNTVVDDFKYWVCIIPSSYGHDVRSAKINEHLYCLDPYVSSSYDYWRQSSDEEDVYIRVDLNSTDVFTLQIRNDSSYSENGFNVFDFFDSFDIDGDLNSTLWDTTFSGNAIVNVTDNVLYSASFHTSQLPFWKTYKNFSSDYNWSLEFRYKAKNSDTTYLHFGFGGYSNFNHFKGFWNSYTGGSTYIYSYWLNGTSGGSSLWGIFSRDVWRDWNITINSTSVILSNDTSGSYLNTATGLESVIYNVGHKPEGSDDNEVYFDDIRVYKIFEDSPIITYEYGSDHINITFNNTGLSVKENYTIELHNINLTGDLNITYLPEIIPVSINISLTSYYGVNSSGGNVNVLNSLNLEEIEYLVINYTVNSSSVITDYYLNYTMNGSNGCALGNKQSGVCYNWDTANRWINFINGTDGINFDGASGNQGDSIIITQGGSSTDMTLSYKIDEHYQNVFKNYDSLFNFSDVKYQDGINQRITGNNVLKMYGNNTNVPLDADQYKLDFRVNYSTLIPVDPLVAYLCNTTYAEVNGSRADYVGCVVIGSKLPSELQDDNTKFRAVFTKNLIDEIGSLGGIYLEHHSPNANRYYTIKTYKAEVPSFSAHWEYSINNGDSYSKLGDGYETELNLNWYYDGINVSSFIPLLYINTSEGDDTLLSNITWDINASQNYPPLVLILEPLSETNVSLPLQINFSVKDPNDDNVNLSVKIYENGVFKETVLENAHINYTNANWSSSSLTGNVSIVLEVCELGTADLFCVNDTHVVNVLSSATSTITVITNVTIDLSSLDFEIPISKYEIIQLEILKRNLNVFEALIFRLRVWIGLERL